MTRLQQKTERATVLAGATADVKISVPYDFGEIQNLTFGPEYARTKLSIRQVSYAHRVLTVQVHNHSAENVEALFAITNIKKP